MTKKYLWFLWFFLALMLAIGSTLLFFSGLGNMPLSDRDEGEYAAVTDAMRRSGDYIIPRLNGKLYIEKPILIFWAIAATQALGVKGETSARLPSSFSAFLVILFIVWLIKRVSNTLPLAILCGIALALTPLTVLMGRFCLTDMMLTLFTTVSLGSFFIASETILPLNNRPWYLLSWFSLALGFLTKGPVALVIVLPTIFFFSLYQGCIWKIIKHCQLAWGLLIFLVINLPWYGLIFYYLGNDFWQAFFISQNLRRFSEVLLGHGGSLFYYLPVLFLGGFPFSAIALPGLLEILYKSKHFPYLTDKLARLHLLAAIAIIVIFLFFSLAATKQINYILPAMPFLALLAGYSLWQISLDEKVTQLTINIFWLMFTILAFLWLLAFLAIPLILPWVWEIFLSSIRPDSSEYALPIQAPKLWLWPFLGALTIALSWLLTYKLAKINQKHLISLILGLTGLLFCSILNIGLIPQVVNLLQAPVKCMVIDIQTRLPQNVNMISYGLWKPTLLYYLAREISTLQLQERPNLEQLIKENKPLIVFTRANLEMSLKQIVGFNILSYYDSYLLGGNEKAVQLWNNYSPEMSHFSNNR